MKQTKYLEVCANSANSAIEAEKGNADRIELCENLSEGGTTPSYGTITLSKSLLHIPIHVLIRPRSGDFLYSELEFEIMKKDIDFCKKIGIDGIVIGILQSNGAIDKKRTKELIKLAEPLNVTFHRAIDMSVDIFQAIDDIIDCGCNRILTSGAQKTAFEGAETIAKMIVYAKDRIKIMVGCGVNENNILQIEKLTGATEFHSSGKKRIESKMEFQNIHISMGNNNVNDEYSYYEVDSMKINKMKNLLLQSESK